MRALSNILYNSEEFVRIGSARMIRRAMLQFREDHQIIKSAMLATVALLKSQDARVSLFKAGVYHCILYAINENYEDEKIAHYGLLSIVPMGYSFSLILLDADKVVVKVMTKHIKNQKIVENSCAIIQNMAKLQVCVNALLEANVIEVLLDCLNEHFSSAKVLTIGCLAFWSLGLQEDKKKLLMRHGAGEFVIRVCVQYQHNTKLLETALSVINNLASIESVAIDLLKMNVGETIIAASIKHPWSRGVQERAVLAIRNLASHNDTNATILANQGAVDVINDAILNHVGNQSISSKGHEALEMMV